MPVVITNVQDEVEWLRGERSILLAVLRLIVEAWTKGNDLDSPIRLAKAAIARAEGRES